MCNIKKFIFLVATAIVLFATRTYYNNQYYHARQEMQSTQKSLQDEISNLATRNAELSADLDCTSEIIADLKENEYDMVYIGEYKISHYCTETYEHICGEGHELTATGTKVTPGRTIAVDPTSIPYGSQVYIEGYGWRIAEDCGSAVKNKHIDMAVNDHDQAMSMGVKYGGVWLLVKKS